jgi:hypothetical protein
MSRRLPLLSLAAACVLLASTTSAFASTPSLRAGAWDCFEWSGIPGVGSGVYVGGLYPVYWPGVGSGFREHYLPSGCAAPDDYVATYASADGMVRLDGLVFHEEGLTAADQLATAPAVGDRGAAHTEAARVVITTDDFTIEATGVKQDAAYRCAAVGALPVSSSSGRVDTLSITTRKVVGGATVESTVRSGPITTSVKIPIAGHGYVIVNGRTEESGNRSYGDHDPYGSVRQAALTVVSADAPAASLSGIVAAMVYYASNIDSSHPTPLSGNPCAIP